MPGYAPAALPALRRLCGDRKLHKGPVYSGCMATMCRSVKAGRRRRAFVGSTFPEGPSGRPHPPPLPAYLRASKTSLMFRLVGKACAQSADAVRPSRSPPPALTTEARALANSAGTCKLQQALTTRYMVVDTSRASLRRHGSVLAGRCARAGRRKVCQHANSPQLNSHQPQTNRMSCHALDE
jgi:hypothetical protein